MEKAELLRGICSIAREFRQVDDVSMYEMVKSSGYLDQYKDVQTQDIAEELDRDPTAIPDWLQYSADKRTSDGCCKGRR